MEYVAAQEKRIAELTTRINRLEAASNDLDLLAGRVQYTSEDQRYTLRIVQQDDGSRQWAWESKKVEPYEYPLLARIKKLEASQCKCKCR